MNFLSRIRAMMGLGSATDNLGEATRRRSIRQDDAARAELHGDIDKTTSNVTAFSAELDRRARKIG
jgi:hypothetical protein